MTNPFEKDRLREAVLKFQKYVDQTLREELFGEANTYENASATFQCVMDYLNEIHKMYDVDVSKHFYVRVEHLPSFMGHLNVSLTPISPEGCEMAVELARMEREGQVDE